MPVVYVSVPKAIHIAKNIENWTENEIVLASTLGQFAILNTKTWSKWDFNFTPAKSRYYDGS